MAHFRDTDAGQTFVSSGDSRETSAEIMEAIAFFARDQTEAEALWNGDGFGVICHTTDLWERVTGNGLREPTEYCWGTAGRNWWSHISAEG